MHEELGSDGGLQTLGRFVDACRMILPARSGFEVSLLSLLVALARAPVSWEPGRSSALLELGPNASRRLINYARSQGLVDAMEDTDGNLRMKLTSSGAAAVQAIASAIA